MKFNMEIAELTVTRDISKINKKEFIEFYAEDKEYSTTALEFTGCVIVDFMNSTLIPYRFYITFQFDEEQSNYLEDDEYCRRIKAEIVKKFNTKSKLYSIIHLAASTLLNNDFELEV